MAKSWAAFLRAVCTEQKEELKEFVDVRQGEKVTHELMERKRNLIVLEDELEQWKLSRAEPVAVSVREKAKQFKLKWEAFQSSVWQYSARLASLKKARGQL